MHVQRSQRQVELNRCSVSHGSTLSQIVSSVLVYIATRVQVSDVVETESSCVW